MPISSTDLNKAYLAYFGRPSDISGRATFENKELADVVSAFDSSAESKALYGDSIVNKINAIYVNLFNRDAEPAGLQHWLSKVMSGELTPAGVAIAILNGAQNDDAKAVANKLAAADAFTKAIDTTAEMLGYSGMAAVNSARAFLKTVNATEASLTAAVKGADTAVATATNAGSAQANQGQTFTLTTSVDNIIGTSGNDTITGGSGASGAASTLGAADSINGGAGDDTFDLTVEDNGNIGPTLVPRLTAVENLRVQSFDVSPAVVDLTNASGVTSIINNNSTQSLTFTNVQALASVSWLNGDAGADNLTVQFKNGVAAGTADTLTVNLNGTNTSGNLLVGNATGTEDFETVSITTTGADANFGDLRDGAGGNSATTTVNFAGDKQVTIAAELETATTLNAAASTGGVRVVMDDAASVTFTGGKGNDRIDVQSTGLTSGDKLDGGEGTDTLRVGDADMLTVTNAANVKNFEILNVTGGLFANEVYDVDNIIANNALTGVLVGATGTTTINDINAGATGNIVVHNDATSITLTAKAFTSGGTSDEATIKLDNDITDQLDFAAADDASGVDVTTLQFDNLDKLNLVTVRSNTQGNQQASIGSLVASDLETIVVTGDNSVAVATANTTTSVTEVSAVGLISTAALTYDQSLDTVGGGVLVLGSSRNDVVIGTGIGSTTGDTFKLGEGSDSVSVDATLASQVRDSFIYTATALNSGDLKANVAETIAGFQTTASAGSVANGDVIDFTAEVEALLKTGATGATLASLTADTAIGTALNNTNNIRTTDAANGLDLLVQIDLNGDGVYSATDDFQITLQGHAGNTLTYVAAQDHFQITADTAAVAINGTSGNDTLTGTAGADRIYGNAGNDIITGGAGADNMDGGAGNDTFVVAAIADFAAGEVVTGGANADILQFGAAGAITYVGRTVTGVETLDLTAGATNAVVVTQGTGLTTVLDLGVVLATLTLNQGTTAFGAAAQATAGAVDVAGEWHYAAGADNGVLTYFDQTAGATTAITLVGVETGALTGGVTSVAGNLVFTQA